MLNFKIIKNLLFEFNRKSFANYIKGTYIRKNVNSTKYDKRCLVMYITKAFDKQQDMDRHQNYRQCIYLAKKIGEYGYNVDVAEYSKREQYFDAYYDLVVDSTGGSNTVYEDSLRPNAKKIAYLTTSNPSVSNRKSQERSSELYNRKGVEIPIRFFPELTKSIEVFDAVLLVGNEYTYATYSSFNMPPTYLIKNNGYSFSCENRCNAKKRTFLYFASTGQVHKGLDLLLDVFSEDNFPYELVVCGNFEKETEFNDLYYKELHKTKNIKGEGFININSERFRDIVGECQFAIFPSCAEGMCGSVLTVMSAGVIPICSKECGFSDEDVFVLKDCKIDTIRDTVYKFAAKEDEWIKRESERAIKISNTKYSFEAFKNSINTALEAIL